MKKVFAVALIVFLFVCNYALAEENTNEISNQRNSMGLQPSSIQGRIRNKVTLSL